MKKILYSILIAGSVGGLAFGATQAFFSDRETSPGNTFQAGKVDLTIDSSSTYNGLPNPAGTWANPIDLTDQRFFDFADVKPGDWGENTISMHIDNNPVWACIDIGPLSNDENGCTEPERLAEGTNATCDNPGNGQGELAQNLRFTAWSDFNCDNVWAGDQEPLLFTNEQGPASDVLNGRTYTLADMTRPVPFPTGTSCIGLQWCAGTMTINHGIPSSITCDGSTMDNKSQTDSLTADVTFRVEQSRNNPNFRCVPLTPTP